eukprot:scaffold25624_cov99-Isochrysis_galbana.AAC.3
MAALDESAKGKTAVLCVGRRGLGFKSAFCAPEITASTCAATVAGSPAASPAAAIAALLIEA